MKKINEEKTAENDVRATWAIENLRECKEILKDKIWR